MVNGQQRQQQQTKLTSFFPIRRSERRPKTEVEAKQQKSLEDRLHFSNDAELGLKVQYFSEKVTWFVINTMIQIPNMWAFWMGQTSYAIQNPNKKFQLWMDFD